MRIHQAVFGPLKGHAFLAGSDDESNEFFRAASWATDLPQTAPHGVAWSPFFHLVRVDDYLLLIYTAPHEGGSRSGMVLSRTAFIPIAAVEQVSDIRPISKILTSPWSPGEVLFPIDLSSLPKGEGNQEPTQLAIQIAAGLGRGTTKPIVVIGQEGFNEAMLDLWARVPAEFRPNMTFGLSFGPDDVRDLAVVCTPSSLVSRWNPTVCLDRTESIESCTHTATLLNLPIDASVRSFANQVQLALDSPAAISIAVRAAQLWSEGRTSADLIGLLRILVERASPTKAEATKAIVVEKLLKTTRSWTSQDIQTMRNLDFVAVPGAAKVLKAMDQWAATTPGREVPQEIGNVIYSWATEKPTDSWLKAVGSGLQSAFGEKDTPDSLYEAIWFALVKDAAVAAKVLTLLPASKGQQKRMVASAPKSFGADLANSLMLAFAELGWWELVGVLLARSRSAIDILASEFNFAGKGAKKIVLTSAFDQFPDQSVVDAAIASQDSMALQIAATACIRTPSTLAGFNWKSQIWFRLLEEAAKISPSIIEALPNRNNGLADLITSGIPDESIWQSIANTSLADLSDITDRATIWSSIPEQHRAQIASVSARGWLTRYEQDSSLKPKLEPFLASVVRGEINANYLWEALTRSSVFFSRLFNEFGFASEADALAFLSLWVNGEITVGESSARLIGNSIRNNNWLSAAEELRSQFRRRPDLRPMMGECYQLLGPVDRLWISWTLDLTPYLSIEDAWAAFEAEAISLYPNGPTDHELWSRSGGQNEDLPSGDTGRAKWHHCIRELRNGKPPGAVALLNEMLAEYSQNEALRQLSRQSLWSRR